MSISTLIKMFWNTTQTIKAPNQLFYGAAYHILEAAFDRLLLGTKSFRAKVKVPFYLQQMKLS